MPRISHLPTYLIVGGAIFSLLPFTPSWLALLMGIAIALFFELPNQGILKKLSTNTLQLAVIGLGAGISIQEVLIVGKQSFFLTLATITVTVLLGLVIGKIFRVEKDTSFLICAGTAICGGSAIAATSACMRAKPSSITISLIVVFALNSIALMIFPPVGHWLQLDQHAFGIWSALAIHDTSSVVGAALTYGEEALAIATTTKLTRALWIVPLALVLTYFSRQKDHEKTNASGFKFPWFILGFILLSALLSYVEILQVVREPLYFAAKRLLVAALFFVGLNLSKKAIKEAGAAPLLQGFVLWMMVSISTLLLATNNLF